jgi:raffinose/stachyose/melibiose transport system permease protein
MATLTHEKIPLREYTANVLFILPALLILMIFYVYPFLEIFNLSFHEWNGISLTRNYVGFQNFAEIAGDQIWWRSILNASYITLIALTFQNALAFSFALACNRVIRLKQFYHLVFFLPPMLSEVVVGLVWRWILDPSVHAGQHIGLLNAFLVQSGFPHLARGWLSDPQTALTTLGVVHSWKGFGWGFVLFLAGLQTIDRQLYEAAKIDGANVWHQFTRVTLPMMRPVILVVIILTILGSMQSFILIISMVQQGLVYHTEMPVTRILTAMTETNRYGYACAMSVTFAGVLILISMSLKIISERFKQE